MHGHLDLFSGIGGFALAAQWAGFRTVGFCEIEPYCQQVLAKNFLADANDSSQARLGQHGGQILPKQASIRSGGSGRARIHSDISQLDGTEYKGVSLITGGFPCQPFSVAGKRRGAADDRHLWPEMCRVIDQARPAFVLSENVPGIIAMELDNVLSDLERIGYACRSFVIPACAVDARHRRNRLWVVAMRISDTGCVGNGTLQHEPEPGRSTAAHTGALCETVPNSNEPRLQGRNSKELRERACKRVAGPSRSPDNECIWLPEPAVGFGSNGLSAELDRGLDATDCLSRSSQVLLNLWERVAPTAIQQTTGGQWRIPAAKVLLANVHGDRLCQRHIGRICETQADCEIPWEALRELWGYGQPGVPSHRWELEQRLASEHPDLMRLLSHYAPPPCSACWRDDSWEDGIMRVAHKIPRRVDRLKGLGNAIVPQVAYQILKGIHEILH